MAKRYLVTGGTGFLGRSIVRALIKEGNEVTVFDNDSRGSITKLNIPQNKFKFIKGDVRDSEAVVRAAENIDSILHLAYINGTEFFYKKPELVLEVAVKGTMNAIDAGIKNKVKEFFFASSSEVYGEPTVIPTPEEVPLIIPNSFNPRYSYSGGKIIGELLTINNSKYFKKSVIFRPHNVYGPAMGFEHVVPQFVLRMNELKKKGWNKFIIQGDGSQSRSFIYIDDFTNGLMLLLKKSNRLQTYNIGASSETTIKELALAIAEHLDMKIKIISSSLAKGSPQRRYPDITKIKKLGFEPKITLKTGLKETIDWYIK